MSRAHQIQSHQLNQQWHTVLGYKETLKVKTVGPRSSMHYLILGWQPRHKPGGGGGVLPMMAYTGRLRPEGVSSSGFRYMKGSGTLLVEVYKRVGKSVVLVRERAQKG